MDHGRVTVILLAVAAEHVELSLQDGASCSHVWHRQGRDGRPAVGRRMVHLASEQVERGGALLRGDPTGDVETLPQDLHAVLSPRFDHVRHVSAPRLWPINERGGQAQEVVAQAS